MPTPPHQMVTFIYVSDLQASAHFYEQILGLKLTLDQGSCRIYAVASSAFIGLCTEKKIAERDGVILTFVSDDLNNWHDHLLAQGVSIDKEPTFNPKYNITHLFCRDPDGYLIEFQIFHEPTWPEPQRF